MSSPDGVDLLLGPMLIGIFLNTILYGILVLQTFIYFQTYRNDAPWLRFLVLYLFVVETINTALDIYLIYEPLVLEFGTSRATSVAPIMISANPIVTVAISTPVQLFIAWRIKILNGSFYLTTSITFFAMCAFVGGVATTVCVTLIPQYGHREEFNGAVITWLASSAIGDIFITIGLVWSLYKRKTGMRVSDSMVNRIIRLTIQTGLVTSISASIDVLTFVLSPNTSLNFVWGFLLSKLYTNSLLSTFNARAGWGNLTGHAKQPNLLFGDDSNHARRTDFSNTQDMLTNTMDIELSPSSPEGSRSKGNPVLEPGVKVTTVVEHFYQEDNHSQKSS